MDNGARRIGNQSDEAQLKGTPEAGLVSINKNCVPLNACGLEGFGAGGPVRS